VRKKCLGRLKGIKEGSALLVRGQKQRGGKYLPKQVLTHGRRKGPQKETEERFIKDCSVFRGKSLFTKQPGLNSFCCDRKAVSELKKELNETLRCSDHNYYSRIYSLPVNKSEGKSFCGEMENSVVDVGALRGNDSLGMKACGQREAFGIFLRLYAH